MNLALHGFLLRVFLWLINFQHGFRLCSAGEPGYLDFDNLPETNFSCLGKVIGGYYADVETGCQMFHVCTIGQKDEIMDIKFLCLNGTVFDQETRVCERVDEVDCSKSERFYNLNLELYGNNAVTLSLHDSNDDDGEPTESLDDQQYTTSVRPSTTTTPTTTTAPSHSTKPSTTTVEYQQPTGYPQHYQPQPPFPSVQTSQSKALYDDKNNGYHRQYHHQYLNDEQSNDQAPSFHLFSNQGGSSTTGAPQLHQYKHSSTSGPHIIHNSPSTIDPIFHGPSSTIQTLLNSNPSFINPLLHGHGIPSTTEQFALHSNNPRETQLYHEDLEAEHQDGRRPLEAVQSTNKGSVSKLSIAPIPSSAPEHLDSQPLSSQSPQHVNIPTSFSPPVTPSGPTIRTFYPTPRSTPKPEVSPTQATQHIHVPPAQSIPQLNPTQITINLPPPDIHRIVQNPSPLLPSQSRVIVTAKASVSDESGRPLNSSELVTLPLPTIPVSYDDYKEGDESFDPFYLDVPKIRETRSAPVSGEGVEGVRATRDESRILSRRKRHDASGEEEDDYGDYEEESGESDESDESISSQREMDIMDIKTIKANLNKFKALFLGEDLDEYEEDSGDEDERDGGSSSQSAGEKGNAGAVKPVAPVGKVRSEERPHLEHIGGVDKINASENVGPQSTEVKSKNSGLEGNEKPKSTLNSGESNTFEAKSAEETEGSDSEEHIESVANVKESDAEEHIDSKSDFNSKGSDAGKHIESKSILSTKESDAGEHIESELISNTKESDDEEYIEPKSIISTKKSDAEEYIEPELIPNTKESDAEEYIKPKSILNTKESDDEEYIEPKSILSTKKSDAEEYIEPKLVPNTKDSDAEEYIEPKSILNTKESDAEEYIEPKLIPVTKKSDAEKCIESKSILNTKESDAEENIEPKLVPVTEKSDGDACRESKSILDTKESDAEETIEPKLIPDTKKSDAEKHIEFKSILNTKESDAEEYIKPKLISNTKESDAEEHIESKSILNTKESNAEEYIKPKLISNTKESDAEEHIESKSILNTKKSDAEEYIEPKSFPNTKESDAEEYIKPKSTLNTGELDKRTTQPQNVSNTKGSKSGNNVELKSTANSRESKSLDISEQSDVEDKVRTKSVQNTKESDAEEHKESIKKSDANETIASKAIENAEASDSGAKVEATLNLTSNKSIDEEIIPMHSNDSNSQKPVPSNYMDHTERYNVENIKIKSAMNAEKSAEEEDRKLSLIRSQINRRSKERMSKRGRETVPRKAKTISSWRKPTNNGTAGNHPLRKNSQKFPQATTPKPKPTVEKNDAKTEPVLHIEDPNLKNSTLMEPIKADEPIPSTSLDTASNEKFNSQIFEEPESQNSKEVDTRAVAQFQPDKKSPKSSAKNAADEEELSDKTVDPKQSNVIPKTPTSNETLVEERVNGEPSIEEREDNESEKSTASAESDLESHRFSDEYSEETPNEFPNKISLNEGHKSARTDKSMKFEKDEGTSSSEEAPSPRQDQSGKLKDHPDSISEDKPSRNTAEGSKGAVPLRTISDEKEESSEYRASLVDSREIASGNDTKESRKQDEASISGEDYSEAEETSSTEENKSSKVEESSLGVAGPPASNESDGVLKFTDEIPQARKNESVADKVPAVQDKESVQDYIDDNYEPAHYKEVEKNSHAGVDSKGEQPRVNVSEKQEANQNDEANKESSSSFEPSEEISAETEKPAENNDTTTTTTTTTTTPRPTPPSLFKPISARKSYNFIPPATTPNPVVIKPRFGLINPKPAKPLKSYNELAPKPVIRQHPLLSRNSLGTSTRAEETSAKRNDTLREVARSNENALDGKTERTDPNPPNIAVEKQQPETAPVIEIEPKEIPSLSEKNVPKYTPTERSRDSIVANKTIVGVAIPATAIPYPLLIASTTERQVLDHSNVNPSRESQPEVAVAESPSGLVGSDTWERSEDTQFNRDSDEGESKYPQEITDSATASLVRRTGSSSEPAFNCLEKELYRFYGDTRDCRLFHYCSPGFTSRQVLDFRFVCEKDTMFDEETQSCRHDLSNPKCAKKNL